MKHADCDEAPRDATQDEADGPVSISLLDDGTIVLADEEVTTAELEEALEEIETTRVVTVKAEPEVTYKAVDDVQQILVSAGVTRVVFVSLP